MLIAHDDTRVESGDHVILFLVDRKTRHPRGALVRGGFRALLTLMHPAMTTKILGILLMLFSVLGTLPPMLVSLIYRDGMIDVFLTTCLSLLLLGGVLWSLSAGARRELTIRDGFLVVTLFWSVLGVARQPALSARA